MFKKIVMVIIVIGLSFFPKIELNSSTKASAMTTPNSNIITEQDLTGDGTLDLILNNGLMWFQVNRDAPPASIGFINAGGNIGQPNFLRAALGSGGMVDQTEYWNPVNISVNILENSPTTGTYKATIVNQANGKEITREYTVSLNAEKPYATIHYLIRNTGTTSFLYDEYPTHIHDGAHMVSLCPIEINDIDTYINGVGVISLPSLYWWVPYTPDQNAPFMVVYQPSNGNAITFGFISPYGSPIHQVVAHYNVSGTPDPSIDVMATEFTLDPSDTIEWNAMVAFHTGGYQRGIQIYSQTRSDQNLLDNPGFEQGLTSWNIGQGSALYTVDSTIMHSGLYSAKGVETNTGSLGRLYQDISSKLVAGQWYQISGWIKTDGVLGQVVIALDYVNSNGWTPVDGYIKEIGHISGTSDWTFYQSTPFQLPPMPADSSALWFLFDFNNGSGTAYWDDVALYHVIPTVVETQLHDNLLDKYPCGPTSDLLGVNVVDPPIVDSVVSFRTNNPIPFTEAYLLINDLPTKHYPVSQIIDPQKPNWYNIEYRTEDSVNLNKFFDLVISVLSSFSGYDMIFLSLELLDNNNTQPIYGSVQDIVLIDDSNIEYHNPVSIELHTIYDRFLAPVPSISNMFGIRCPGVYMYFAASPVDLLLTDSQGRQTGNLSPEIDILNIPSSYYSGASTEPEVIIVYKARDNSYDNLRVTGTTSGMYDLLMAYHFGGPDGIVVGDYLKNIPTDLNKIDYYEFGNPLLKFFLPLSIK